MKIRTTKVPYCPIIFLFLALVSLFLFHFPSLKKYFKNNACRWDGSLLYVTDFSFPSRASFKFDGVNSLNLAIYYEYYLQSSKKMASLQCSSKNASSQANKNNYFHKEGTGKTVTLRIGSSPFPVQMFLKESKGQNRATSFK